MTLLKFLVGALLAGSIDIAFGIFFAHLFLKLYDPAVWPLFAYGFGIVFCLAPDLDVLVMRFTRGRIMADHRTWMHWPILIAPIFLLVSCFSSPFAILAVFCLLEHYVHDSIDIEENDEGIRWFAPFNYNHYLISWQKIKNLEIFARLSGRRLRKIKNKKETMNSWLAEHYLRPTASSIVGGLLLAASIIMITVW